MLHHLCVRGSAKRVAVLGSVAVLAWLAALLVAESTFEDDQFRLSVCALVLCLVPALTTLVFIEWINRRSPQQVVPAIIASIGIRMFSVVVGTVVLGERLAGAGVERERFAAWVVGLYLVILVMESLLLILLVRTAGATTVP